MTVITNERKNLVRLLTNARKSGLPVIHIRAEYNKDKSRWMPVWEELNLKSGKGHVDDVVPDCVCDFAAELPGELIIAKNTFDGFLGTSLEEKLRELGIEKVYVSGMVTSCCVLFTAVTDYFFKSLTLQILT